MRVTLASQDVVVSFHNISEPIAHDGTRSFNKTEFFDLQLLIRKFKRESGLGRYIRFKLPTKRISVITTICKIHELGKSGNILSTGFAYYSKSELQAGVKFNRPRAWRMSLGRAIKAWPLPDQTKFLHAFDEFLVKRDTQIAQSKERSRNAVDTNPVSTSSLAAVQSSPAEQENNSVSKR